MELNESAQRLTSQLNGAEKQLRQRDQNEEKLKQECEQLREQKAAGQVRENKLVIDLTETQQKVSISLTLISTSPLVLCDAASTVL